MCAEQFGAEPKGFFDPHRCPLLQGLSPEQQKLMMATDPRIRACMGAIASGTTTNLEPCVAKMVSAHEKRGVKAASGRSKRSTSRVA